MSPAPQRVLVKINYDLKSSANVSRLCGIFIYLFKFSKMKEGYVVRDRNLPGSCRICFEATRLYLF